MRRTPLLSLLAVPALAAAVAGCGGSSDTVNAASTTSTGAGGDASLSLVAYSTPQEVYARLIPQFQRTAAGAGVRFTRSYGASGDQSRAVDQGQPADVVALSLAPDVTRLVKDGLVRPGWNAGPTHGMVTDSVVAIVVRRGNPKHLHGWDDLLRPGVQVDTPNPFSSGGARWNIMAAYGAWLKETGSPSAALAKLRELITRHVEVQDKSARDALQTFTGGTGDALISYENEAITAQRKGKPVDYVIPSSTILIENPVAVTADSGHPQQAEAFVRFLLSPAAQTVWGEQGYRPVLASVAARFHFPRPSGLFTIGSLGGWDTVMKRFFDPQSGAVAKIEQAAGVSTAK